jgi:membrane fusion protein, multidrug efflux system
MHTWKWGKSVVFAICSMLFLVGCHDSNKHASKQKSIVEIAQVKLQSWQDNLKTTGMLSALQGVQFKSEVAGRVTKIYFHPGDKVRAGEILLEINPANAEAQYRAAQAASILQQSNYHRAQLLYRQHVISQADLDTALYNQNSALSREKSAQASLDLAVIKAPFAGTMGLALINLGSYVSVGTPLFNLEKLDQLRVDFHVPERYGSQAKVGDRVVLSPGVVGRVTGVDTAIDQDTQMLGMQALIDNSATAPLLPGSFVDIQWFYGAPHQVLWVPQTAILDEGITHKVYRVKNGIAHAVLVTTGQHVNDQVIIQSGLKNGDFIVTNGLIKLHDGDPVTNARAS